MPTTETFLSSPTSLRFVIFLGRMCVADPRTVAGVLHPDRAGLPYD
ncbi:MAG TPA: hypothetical protein VGP53_08050 [Acidimicrobiales bacterium]|nr:hypothetical protein [Acidimicrobiales bacterium]